MNAQNFLLRFHDQKLLDLIIEEVGLPEILIGIDKPNILKTEYYDHHDLLYCIYDKETINNYPPIDSILLSKLKSYESIYLKMCERMHFGNMSYDERIQTFYKHIRFWNYKLDEKKITHFIQYNVPHEGYDFIIYSLCKIKNIKTIFSYKLPVLKNLLIKRYFIEDIFKHSKGYVKKETESSPDILEQSFKNLYYSIYPEKSFDNNQPIFKTYPRLAKATKKSFRKNIFLLFESFKNDNLKTTLKKISRRFTIIHDLRYKNPYLISDKKLIKKYDKKISKNIPDGKYIFVALHYQPELSTVPLGDNYSDQNLILNMISWVCNKYGINILVKRHPRIDERNFARPKDFYERMKDNKNIFFVDNNIKVTDLINGSLAVASITGSICWEAFLRKKPSILFGHTIFDDAPGIFKINSLKDLSNAINVIFNDKIRISKYDVINYLKFLEKYTFDNTHEKLFFTLPSNIKEESIRQNFVKNLLPIIKK